MEEQEKENLNKNTEDNKNEKIEKEDKFEKLKNFLSSYKELVIFVLSVVIPAILGASYKLRRSSYYGYPVEFFDVDFTYIISRTIIISFIAISRKKDFEIFKEMYEESKKRCEEGKNKNEKVPNSKKIYVWFVKIVLCLTSFFRENKKIRKLFEIFYGGCVIIFGVFFIAFLFMGGPELQKEYLIFKDEKGNEKAVVSIKGTDYKYSDCRIEKIGTYKNGAPKYKLTIYTSVKESISQDDVKPKTNYFYKVEINKNGDKPE